METLIVHLDSKEKAKALKIVLEAMKIDFETGQESAYDPNFIKKIKAGEKEFNEGIYTSITPDEVWKKL